MLKNYKDGIGRSDFITGIACYFGVFLIAIYILLYLVRPFGLAIIILLPIVALIWSPFIILLFAFVPGLIIKRLHDIGLSGWYSSLLYIVLFLELAMDKAEHYLPVNLTLIALFLIMMGFLSCTKGKEGNRALPSQNSIPKVDISNKNRIASILKKYRYLIFVVGILFVVGIVFFAGLIFMIRHASDGGLLPGHVWVSMEEKV